MAQGRVLWACTAASGDAELPERLPSLDLLEV
jgi:hypothetical protein